MTRKHFQAIADALKASKPNRRIENYPSMLVQWIHCVEHTATACAQFNSAFDRSRFLGACGYDA